MAEGEAALGELVVDADRLEGLERVALQRDAVAHAAQLVAQVDEHHLDALLGEAEGQHAPGDAAADDEDPTTEEGPGATRSWDLLGG